VFRRRGIAIIEELERGGRRRLLRPVRDGTGPVTTSRRVLPILECGDPLLRRPAEHVDPASLASVDMRRLIEQMRATMEDAPGVGLAAPQIGVPIQLAVLQDTPDGWSHLSDEDRAARERSELPFTVLVNPVVLAAGEDRTASFYEGCLSVPGLTGLVTRHRTVRVEALDEQGRPVDRVFSGWPARIVQHEVDHLRGVLYLDRVETRSLCTADTYAQLWAGRPPAQIAAALGFEIGQ
jgi:peptide deformylase